MGDVEMGDTTLNGGVTDEFDPTDGGALPRDDDTRLKLVRRMRKQQMTISGSAKLIYLSLQLPGDVPGAASFEFTNEDHTLGNALRYIIMKKYVKIPEFAGILSANLRLVPKLNSAATPSHILQTRK